MSQYWVVYMASNRCSWCCKIESLCLFVAFIIILKLFVVNCVYLWLGRFWSDIDCFFNLYEGIHLKIELFREGFPQIQGKRHSSVGPELLRTTLFGIALAHWKGLLSFMGILLWKCVEIISFLQYMSEMSWRPLIGIWSIL